MRSVNKNKKYRNFTAGLKFNCIRNDIRDLAIFCLHNILMPL